jgi:hypothetical protein
MDIDVARASSFLVAHARLPDRRRFEPVIGTGRPQGALSALSACRNEDGGFGRDWSRAYGRRRPAEALHAFAMPAETGPETGAVRAPFEMAGRLCDRLAEVSRPGGCLPFAPPLTEPTRR